MEPEAESEPEMELRVAWFYLEPKLKPEQEPEMRSVEFGWSQSCKRIRKVTVIF